MRDEITGQEGVVMGVLPPVETGAEDETEFGRHTGWVQLQPAITNEVFTLACPECNYQKDSKAGLTDSEARDVVQETMVAVVKQMPEFEYNRAAGRFKNWLLTIATRRIIDQLRRQGRLPPAVGRAPEGTDTGTPLLERLPDPAGPDLERVWDEEWRKNLADAAIERVKQKVKPRRFQIFDCYVLRSWPMARVMSKLRVSRGQVYFAKYRIGAVLRAESRRLEKEWG